MNATPAQVLTAVLTAEQGMARGIDQITGTIAGVGHDLEAAVNRLAIETSRARSRLAEQVEAAVKHLNDLFSSLAGQQDGCWPEDLEVALPPPTAQLPLPLGVNYPLPTAAALQGPADEPTLSQQSSDPVTVQVEEQVSAEAAEEVLTQAANLPVDPYVSRNRASLATECQTRGLSQEGTRGDLAQRLLEHDRQGTPVSPPFDVARYARRAAPWLRTECRKRGLSEEGNASALRLRLAQDDVKEKVVE